MFFLRFYKVNKKIFQYSYSLKKESELKAFINFLFVIILFVVINLIIKYLCFPVVQTSVSMSPDLSENSVVMVSTVSKKYDRGDVVLIDSKVQKELKWYESFANVFVRFFTAQQISIYESKIYPGTKQKLRRVVGLPGDRIYMRDYVLYVKPAGEKHFFTEFEITKKTYNVSFNLPPTQWDVSIGITGAFEEMTLGDNEYFVLSDNRLSSEDSRIWGVVKNDAIFAKALLCYFPFNKIKLL